MEETKNNTKTENEPAIKAENAPTVKRNYKDSVFRMLFNDKDSLLSLFNALTGSHYEDPNELEITTLENVIYMNRKNDLACMLDMQLHLYEHQSSVNPNMPLRYLPYVADMYEKWIVNENIYSKKRIRLPAPQFVVFYNGTEPQPERKILRLSDSFGPEEKNSATDTVTNNAVINNSDIKLELEVLQLNINPGYNKSIKKDCRLLTEYCQYVSKVREYSRTMELREAVEQAVTECIQERILENFLKKNRAEVIHMSIYEFDEEKYRKALRQESWDDGWAEGREFGIKENNKNIAFRMFAKNNPLEDVSDTLGISMDYTLELHQQYEHMVQEEANYGEK